MLLIRTVAIIAIASASLSLGACINKHKQQVQPAPANIGTSK